MATGLLSETARTARRSRISFPERAGLPAFPCNLYLRRLALVLLVLGVACRFVRYLLNFPFWGDEAFICLNLIGRDYTGLTRQLDCNQVAPVLFLWVEKTALLLWGSSEWALRLLPFLAGLAGFVLFGHLARLTLSPLAAALAIGLLAVARWPVSMATFVKPYSFDLLLALALLVPAVHWLRRPDRPGWLGLLALLTPLCLMGSYPAVFVAGGVSLALLPTAWPRRSGVVGPLYLAFNAVLVATFLACYLLVGRAQAGPATGGVKDFMLTYWADGFPPAQPWPLVRWFVLIHTGRMMAYPVGDANGGSALTFLLFVVGVWRFGKEGRWPLLALCLTPFALNLLAAALRAYPYGGCCRLSQHLAPAVCLLAGVGAATGIQRLARSAEQRLRGALVLGGLLGLCGGVGMWLDAARPYRDEEALWTRRLVSEVLTQAGPNDSIIVAGRPLDDWPLLRWQLVRQGDRFTRRHEGQDWDDLNPTGDRVWVVTPWLDDPRSGEKEWEPPDDCWDCLGNATYTLRRTRAVDPTLHCHLTCWRRRDAQTPVIKPVLSCWP